MSKPVQVYLAFDDLDFTVVNLIHKHCAAMEKKKAVEIWHHRMLRPGQIIEQEVERRLQRAEVIVLMISASLLSSDAFHVIEKTALERLYQKQCIVLPIYLKHAFFTGYDFTSLQMLPSDGEPVVKSDSDLDLDKRCKEVAEEIHTLVENLLEIGYNETPDKNTLGIPFQSEGKRQVILYLSNNPKRSDPNLLNEEINCIKQRLVLGKCSCSYELIPKNVENLEALQRALLETRPSIVHFSSYATQEDKLVFKNEDGTHLSIDPQALCSFFALFNERLQLVFLNACYSEPQAKAVQQVIPFVIGIDGGEVVPSSALDFVKAFYQSIAYGTKIPKAYAMARSLLQMKGTPHFERILLLENDTTPKQSTVV